MTVFIALLLICSMMYLLLKNKVSPIVAFVCLPIVAALLLGTPFATVVEWSKGGITTTMGNATLFIFSIIYFGIMSDAGMFDPIVAGLVKISGKKPVMIYIATALIALVSQLDGATATTYLITIPAMLPIFKKLHLNPLGMLCVIGVVTGSWNMVPWGGTIIRTATTVTNLTGVEVTPQQLWNMILPIEVLGLALGIGLAVWFGIKDKKRVCKEYGNDFFENIGTQKVEISVEDQELKRPKLLLVNIALTVALVVLMILYADIPSYLVFMTGTALALVINYRGLEQQTNRISAHAATALGTAATFLAAGVFLGIFKEAGMTTALANVVLNNLPNGLLTQVGRIFGVFGSAIGIVLSPDLYYYSLLPVVGEVVMHLGGDPTKVGLAMLIGENIGVIVSPCIPTTFLAIGLAGVQLKDHIKFSLKYFIGVSAILVLVAMIMGVA